MSNLTRPWSRIGLLTAVISRRLQNGRFQRKRKKKGRQKPLLVEGKVPWPFASERNKKKKKLQSPFMCCLERFCRPKVISQFALPATHLFRTAWSCQR